MADETKDKSLGGKQSTDFMARLQKKLKSKEDAAAEGVKTAPLASTQTSGVKPPEPKTKATTFEERHDPIVDESRTTKNLKRDSKSSKVQVKSVLKTLGVIAISAVIVIALVVGGYVVYLSSTYHRIEDMRYIAVSGNKANSVSIGNEYTITTFNIGFGAYSQGFSFFMDEGQMISGEKTVGESSRAASEEDVLNNTNGALSLLQSKAVSDFYFFQEVDTDSSRSYYIDQSKMIADCYAGTHSVSFASNFHTGQLFYPLNQPIGKIYSGIMTLSKYMVSYSVRRTLPVSTNFIEKFFDLDRCFMVSKLPIQGTSKALVLINVHLSAYDKGDIRTEQLKVLYDYINYEYNENENYVIVGGDFNHSLAGEDGIFANQMIVPEWCKTLPAAYSEEKFAEIGYSINYDLSTTIGTCRDSSTHYSEGVNLEVILDGFITSANIRVVRTETIDGDFKNSDHNPVKMTFELL